MRVVATSDTHFSVDVSTIPDGDVFIHAGDLMTTGYPDDWKTQLEWLAELPHKKKLFIPGNHDFHMQVYPGPALQDMRRVGVTVLGLPGNDMFTTTMLDNDMMVLGLPFVRNLPRWAFNYSEEYVSEYLTRMRGCAIVVSHSPIYGILDGLDDRHSGYKCYMDFLKKHNPLYWIHGHMHESYGYQRIKNTLVHNVSMCDHNFQHANKPLVLDV